MRKQLKDIVLTTVGILGGASGIHAYVDGRINPKASQASVDKLLTLASDFEKSRKTDGEILIEMQTIFKQWGAELKDSKSFSLFKPEFEVLNQAVQSMRKDSNGNLENGESVLKEIQKLKESKGTDFFKNQNQSEDQTESQPQIENHSQNQPQTENHDQTTLPIESHKIESNEGKTVDDVADEIIKKGLDIDLEDLLTNYKTFLGTLNQEQLALLINSSFSFCILSLVISSITIFFGNELLKYFNIESKFPKLKRFIDLRGKITRYSLIFYLLTIVILLSLQFSFNIIAFLTS